MMVSKRSYVANQNDIGVDLYTNSGETHAPLKTEFAFGFIFSGILWYYYQNSFEYDFIQVESYLEGENNLVYTETSIPLVSCLEVNLGPKIKQKIKDAQMYTMLCPNTTDIYFMNTDRYFPTKHARLEVRLKNSTGNSLSFSEYQSLQSYFYVQTYILQSYIDYSDINDPIKITVRQDETANIFPNYKSEMRIKIKKNMYSINNDYIGSNYLKGNFYSVTGNVLLTSPLLQGQALGSVTFIMDNVETRYNARVYSFLDLTSQLGGIYEVVHIFLSIILSYLSGKLYYHDIIMSSQGINSYFRIFNIETLLMNDFLKLFFDLINYSCTLI